ncbi:MAG TPA: acyl-CoA carboxylase subunit epsilon [Nocardioides sp.]|uniref:acyl-CoA carboxylase subunit epsilon n=1 Tax=Nocardioides sp. TaxID=35761 RepID=UPI002F41E274
MTDESASEASSAPYLRVVKGDPTPEELAALVAVLATLGSPDAAPPRRTQEWNAPRRMHRVVPPHGPGGWRASGLPR